MLFSPPPLKLSAIVLLALLLGSVARVPIGRVANAQTNSGQPMRLEADIQEANAKTGVVTARGNVRITYPSRQVQATAAQAQYFSREGRIVLSGNVYVLQQGNSLRGETVTYLLNEGRFVALPQSQRQVESIYIVPEASPPPAPAASPPFSTESEFSAPSGTSLPPGQR
ncbi:LptA/OstA family protein [Leptolyngbya sp. FACHB-36]|uniref:LptA/OstA family protein n=1 Tax=Leptolyngbya sp. FACHB-36 TaxID=2692808 RepID=UPI0018EF636C